MDTKKNSDESVVDLRNHRRVTSNVTNYGAFIKTMRDKRGLSQGDIARALHIAPMLISHWEHGNSRPDIDLIPPLCDLLKITPNVFFGAPIPTEKQIEIEKVVSLLTPGAQEVVLRTAESLLEYDNQSSELHNSDDAWQTHFDRLKVGSLVLCAGLVNPLESDSDEYDSTFLRSSRLTRQADEILRVSGDSMEPTFYDGDELLVKYTPYVSEGEIGVFVINGEGFVKEFRGNGVYSHNSEKYPFREFVEGDDVRCVGRVLGKLTPDMYPTERELEILNELELEGKF